MKLAIKSALLMSSVMLAGCSMMTDDSSFNQAVPAVNVYQETTPQAVPPSTTYQFPASRVPTGNNTVIIDPNKHIWGAYDPNGVRVAQGPIPMDNGYCSGVGGPCKTPAGTFTVYYKGGSGCKSTLYPIPTGGAPMPYCMLFKEGYGLYGSEQLPNYSASNGCIRLYPRDAQWLNKNFVTIGTRVQILP
jgi:lipoprotein-anchoring transpeptidase ErfK/SrfK